MRYFIHITNGTIHNGDEPCYQGKRMKESNKKWFDSYDEAVNFYEGEKKGVPCAICKPEIEK